MKKGMNPEAVEALAGRLEDGIESLNAIYEGRLGYITDLDWTGEDRDRFIPQFEEEVGSLSKQCVEILAELAERLRKNAQEQRETSSN